MSSTKELYITEDGWAELTDGAGRVLWASDSDETFRGQFPDLLDESDADAIAEYLEDSGIIEPGELDEDYLGLRARENGLGKRDKGRS